MQSVRPQVIDRCETDISFRYFLQVGCGLRLPDASLLTRFRGRLGAEGFQQIFQQLVAIARAEGLVKDRLRLKDASHVIAKIVTCFTVNVKRMVKLLTTHSALSSARGVGLE